MISYMFFASDNNYSWSAAWVQAIGSIAAILVAVYVPSKLEIKRQQREKEERERVESVAQHALVLELTVIRSTLQQYKVFVIKNVALLDFETELMPEKNFSLMSGASGGYMNFFKSLEAGVMSKFVTLIAMIMHVDTQRKITLAKSKLGELSEEDVKYMVDCCDESIEICNELIGFRKKEESKH